MILSFYDCFVITKSRCLPVPAQILRRINSLNVCLCVHTWDRKIPQLSSGVRYRSGYYCSHFSLPRHFFGFSLLTDPLYTTWWEGCDWFSSMESLFYRCLFVIVKRCPKPQIIRVLMGAARDDDVVDKVVWTICIPLLRIQNPRLSLLQVEARAILFSSICF